MVIANANQIPVYSDGHLITWHFETDDGILAFSLDDGNPSAEWIDWDDDADDWIGKPVAVGTIKHLIPATLYS